MLRPIDFQDLVWGLDVWDLSISIASLHRFDETGRLHEHFRRGYAAVRSWPDVGSDVMAALIAARRLHQLNLTLNLNRPDAAEAVERMTRSIANWMNDGNSTDIVGGPSGHAVKIRFGPESSSAVLDAGTGFGQLTGHF